ncbi:MAG TPA: SusD/RagB family nutrient-binding outer membrane lipoprotein, partial [Longimicrobium sp.]
GSTLHYDYAATWIQHYAKIQYTNEDRYQLRSTGNDAHWLGFYAGALQDFQGVIAKADSTGEPNKKAAALVMKSWTMGIVTDVWGDVPYTQANLGLDAIGGDRSVTSPKYDPQQVVYNGLFAELTAAAKMITPSGSNFGTADLIYGGDMAKWRKFANSLHLRHAMRLSQVDPAKGRAEFVAAMSDAGGVFTSNADNAMLQYQSSRPNNHPLNELFRTRYDQVISKTLVDTLNSLKDPRVAIYADKNAFGEYRGAQNAVTSPKVPFDSLSSIGAYFLAPDAPGMLQSYAEVLLLQAEAAQRGWIAGNAAELYQAAIRANMSFYGISSAQIDAYLAQPRVAYAGLPSIHLQKWIVLYGNGPEAWAEQRRTDTPALKRGPNAASSVTTIPMRFTYPLIEQSVNDANRLEAIQRQYGKESVTLNDKVWWDK